jgi:hypothetical protein
MKMQIFISERATTTRLLARLIFGLQLRESLLRVVKTSSTTHDTGSRVRACFLFACRENVLRQPTTIVRGKGM